MQAIFTVMLPATETKPKRVMASVSNRSRHLVEPWSDARTGEGNHKYAAHLLAKELGWKGHWHGGYLPGNVGLVFVCADRVLTPEFVVD